MGGCSGGCLGGSGLVHHGGGMVGELPSCSGECGGAGGAAVDEAGADLMLQALETFGQRGRGEMQSSGGPPEMLFLAQD